MKRINVKDNPSDTNIISYLYWRGDIPFSCSPFNEVDAAILNQLSYIKFDGIIPLTLAEKIPLPSVAKAFFDSPDYDRRSDNGPFINPLSIELLKLAGKCARYKNVRLSYFKSDVNYIEEKQFAAFTAFLDDSTVYVAFRGTHNEIVGWKEDFNMAFESPVPAQTEAVEYLENVSAKTICKIRVGGHSKGGNLAVYAGVFCGSKTSKRILQIYNDDGPGFDSKIINDPKFQKMLPKINSFMPQSSIVGMLFEHAGNVAIVESSAKDFMQHDMFSWIVLGTSFVRKTSLDSDSRIFDKSLKTWLEEMDGNHRKKFVDAVFGIFKASESETLSDFSENWLKNSSKILKHLQNIDEETKEDVSMMIKIFVEETTRELTKGIAKNIFDSEAN